MTNDQNPLNVLSAADINPPAVYSCHVILSVPDEQGFRTARVANLPQICVRGTTERDLLFAVVKEFKSFLTEGLRDSGELQWAEPPQEPQSGEQQRFIPVHL